MAFDKFSELTELLAANAEGTDIICISDLSETLSKKMTAKHNMFINTGYRPSGMRLIACAIAMLCLMLYMLQSVTARVISHGQVDDAVCVWWFDHALCDFATGRYCRR